MVLHSSLDFILSSIFNSIFNSMSYTISHTMFNPIFYSMFYSAFFSMLYYIFYYTYYSMFYHTFYSVVYSRFCFLFDFMFYSIFCSVFFTVSYSAFYDVFNSTTGRRLPQATASYSGPPGSRRCGDCGAVATAPSRRWRCKGISPCTWQCSNRSTGSMSRGGGSLGSQWSRSCGNGSLASLALEATTSPPGRGAVAAALLARGPGSQSGRGGPLRPVVKRPLVVGPWG